MSEPLLVTENLSKTFRSGDRRVIALDNVSLSLRAGETLGIVGPSGSGKSTFARIVTRLIEPDSGTIRFAGEDFRALQGSALRKARRRIQMVFQDPLGSFNPRTTIGAAIEAPLRIHRLCKRCERAGRVAELLTRVGLDPDLARRGVHEVSGGQRQRAAIARALACRPDLIVLDEAVSALDVSVRARILELLVELQRSDGIAYLFVGHDLAVVRAVSHDVAIMDGGKVVEEGESEAVILHPQSKTGRALLAAAPRLSTA